MKLLDNDFIYAVNSAFRAGIIDFLWIFLKTREVACPVRKTCINVRVKRRWPTTGNFHRIKFLYRAPVIYLREFICLVPEYSSNYLG